LNSHENQEDKVAVLKLKKHDENKEIDFELKYLMSLTTRQRFEMMFEKSRQMAALLRKNGRRKTVIIKRAKDGSVEKIYKCRSGIKSTRGI
jgi:hypothetical protein